MIRKFAVEIYKDYQEDVLSAVCDELNNSHWALLCYMVEGAALDYANQNRDKDVPYTVKVELDIHVLENE